MIPVSSTPRQPFAVPSYFDGPPFGDLPEPVETPGFIIASSGVGVASGSDAHIQDRWHEGGWQRQQNADGSREVYRLHLLDLVLT